MLPGSVAPALTVRECEARHRQLMDALPVALYTTDACGHVTYFNQEAAALWGREPELGKDLWCGSWKIFWPDGRPMAFDACPMAVTLQSGNAVRGQEIVIERPDGSRRHVMPHPSPIRDAFGDVTGAINMLMDITEQKETDSARASLGAIVECSDDAIISKDLKGVIRSWNDGARRMFGYTADEAIGRHISMLIPLDRHNEEPMILERLIRGERIDHYETVRRTKDGRFINISLCVSPVRNSYGRIIGASKVARDITDRKKIETELNGQRTFLEEEVRSRSAELEHSTRRLRMAERMASLGTLSAGLGHDVANLLVPLRVRLESLARAELSKELREDVEAIGSSAEYLQRLANGLRLIASDPERAPRGEATSLLTWWEDVKPMLKNVLPHRVVLKSKLPKEDCIVAMSRIALTQVVFNLVQNSGDAMKVRGSGTVTVSAEPLGEQVRLTVVDDGPGMTSAVQARCMEPFFSTKSRAISTGLGLALVYGLVRDAGGSILPDSTPGHGTSFTLTLPSGKIKQPATSAPAGTAVVRVKDARLGAFITAELRAQAFAVHDRQSVQDTVDVLVVDDLDDLPRETEVRDVIVLGKPKVERPGVSVIDLPLKPQTVREVISRLRRER